MLVNFFTYLLLAFSFLSFFAVSTALFLLLRSGVLILFRFYLLLILDNEQTGRKRLGFFFLLLESR